MNPGRIRRVNGPLIEVDELTAVAMAELVELGPQRLLAEVVSLRSAGNGRATAVVQAYEYTGGLRPGQPVHPLGRPLAARLGPGLLGGVYDGLLRPLKPAPIWLAPGTVPGNQIRRWRFTPAEAKIGDVLGPGKLLGTVDDAGPVPHRVLVPPGVHGALTALAEDGRYRDDEPVARVGETAVPLADWWPVRLPRPYQQRHSDAPPLLTGQRIVDAVFPLCKGGTAAVPGGFGTGKTVLLQQIAKWCTADVLVYVGCGERGNELADVLTDLAALIDPRSGGALADRTVIIANTSNMPIMAREASIHTGVTVAEYYRDMGYDAVVIADSTSRWAEALREFASRSGALPAEEGYPAGLASALAAFYERASLVTPLGGGTGSVSIIGAVSPPGGDMTEPVTAHTQRFVRSVWMLDRELAYARHYPAVAWRGSYCRDVEIVGAWQARNGDAGWAPRRARTVSLLAEADRLADLAQLVGTGALPGHERMTMLAGRLIREAVLQQNASSGNDGYSTPAKTAALIDAVLAVAEAADQAVASGVPAAVLENSDLSVLLRAREETGPADAEGVRQRAHVLLARLREVS
ncbi:V-type ATP synthase subunit A [Actinoplanes sp. NPDC024001]|uniref:V-type ATP synthase subunit A n=1 Tax=Actinoplanes sp. NPDC024001 TaxID=3154598 RepID=UPI0033E87AFD